MCARSVRTIAAALVVGSGLGCPGRAPEPEPSHLVAAAGSLGDTLATLEDGDLDEPSGIAFDPARNSLWVVGDDGDLGEFRLDGRPVQVRRILPGHDLEGITLDQSRWKLYVAVEGREQILEIDPGAFRVTRTFTVPRTFEGRTVMAEGGSGLEGIAFVPDPKHPEGGTFWVANQAFPGDPDEVSGLFEVELPLRTSTAAMADGTIVRQQPLDLSDLSGVHYEPVTGHLWVLSDTNDTVLVYDRRTAQVVARYDLPGRDQEGITTDAYGRAYLAQDSGGILKVRVADAIEIERKPAPPERRCERCEAEDAAPGR